MSEHLQIPNPPHPGEYIRKELMERDWTQKHFAGLAKMSLTTVSEIINGRVRINVHRAIAIGKAFSCKDCFGLGTSPELWMNLQRDYDLWRAGYRKERGES